MDEMKYDTRLTEEGDKYLRMNIGLSTDGILSGPQETPPGMS